VKISDKKVGDGAGAKKGQRLEMRYILKLANGKVVDKNTSGAPVSYERALTSSFPHWLFLIVR
jgi:FK506-binding nuclear protein